MENLIKKQEKIEKLNDFIGFSIAAIALSLVIFCGIVIHL